VNASHLAQSITAASLRRDGVRAIHAASQDLVDVRHPDQRPRTSNIGEIKLDEANSSCYGSGMARPRKIHVQLELPKLDKNGQHRGGKRTGAGRKACGLRPSQPHKKRALVRPTQPVHVTLRLADDLAELRNADGYHAVRNAMVSVFVKGAAADSPPFRIVHASIQHGHLHLLAEADDQYALARGVQGFEIAAAKELNKLASKRLGRRRKGQVFPDRYHAEVITTPTQANRALNYVLNNWRKHREDRAPLTRTWTIDPFSSASNFPGWAELAESPWMWGTRDTYDRLPTWRARTWLLSKGWMRGGPPISAQSVRGAR
jgi:hypothetical protein